MYQRYFKLDSAPFSIAPDPEFLFMSQGHKEALAHLSYVLHQNGGFVLLTGEVGTGKTTVCRAFLKTLPSHIALAYIINPKISGLELLMAIARELDIAAPEQKDSRLAWQQVIYEKLLAFHGQGKQTLLMIDEAQNLAPDVLEEVRLLTNLETDKHKLLSIILMGQPELREMLSHYELRQLNQRITARFHLNPLSAKQVREYLAHRLKVAGLSKTIFSSSAQKRLHKLSSGVPRLINVLADRSLLAAYVGEKTLVNSALVTKASKEVLPARLEKKRSPLNLIWLLLVLLIAAGLFNKDVIFSELKTLMGSSADAKLADYWQLDPSEELCFNNQLVCYQGEVKGAELASLGHPLLRYDSMDKAIWVPIAQLKKLPANQLIKVLVVWQPPTGYEKTVRPGETAKIIIWLREQFDSNKENVASDGWEIIRPANFNAEKLDAELTTKLKAFQQKQGLKPDGILGPKTLMMINNVKGLLPQANRAK